MRYVFHSIVIVATVGSCDSIELDTDLDNAALVDAARSFYTNAIAHPPSDAASTHFAHLALRRPPTWSKAQVVRRSKGERVIAVELGGHDRLGNDSLAFVDMVVFEVTDGATINSARILDFAVSSTTQETALVTLLEGYWHDTFEALYVSVAEFSIHYEPLGGRVFRAGEPPRLARVEVQRQASGKHQVVQASCWVLVMCYFRVDTGELLFCDWEGMHLLFCEDDDEDGGGGGDGDDDDDEDDDDEDEDDGCTCPNEQQCKLATEYEERSTGFAFSCDQFANAGGSPHFSWAELNGGWAGGNEPEHAPWGYIDQFLPPILEALRLLARADSSLGAPVLYISSGFRCPDGNFNTPGAAPKSNHQGGIAVDISTRRLWGHLHPDEWRARYEVLRVLALSVGFDDEELNFYTYSDHHLHLSIPRSY